jgi:ApbE superfamily uncharacterized protein (UPF0280 family)
LAAAGLLLLVFSHGLADALTLVTRLASLASALAIALAHVGALALIEVIDQVDPPLRQRFLDDLVVICTQSPSY